MFLTKKINPKDDLGNLHSRGSAELAILAGHQKNLLAYPDGGTAQKQSWRVSKASFLALFPSIATGIAVVWSLATHDKPLPFDQWFPKNKFTFSRSDVLKMAKDFPTKSKVILAVGVAISGAIWLGSYLGMLGRYKKQAKAEQQEALADIGAAHTIAHLRETGQVISIDQQSDLFERERIKDQIDDPRVSPKEKLGVLAVAKGLTIGLGAILHVLAHRLVKKYAHDENDTESLVRHEMMTQGSLLLVDAVALAGIDRLLTKRVKAEEKKEAIESLMHFDNQPLNLRNSNPLSYAAKQPYAAFAGNDFTHLEKQRQRETARSATMEV